MALIFPPGTDPRIEQYLTDTPIPVVFKHINFGVLTTRHDSPTFAFILLYNRRTQDYERMLAIMDKVYGKSGRSIILSLVLQSDMGFDHVSALWLERSVGITTNLLKSIEICDEKYIRFFLEDPKFLRLAKGEFSKKFTIIYIKKHAMRLIVLGFTYPKFSKLMIQLYSDTGDDVFLPPAAKDIFLF